jgi:predicted outer membrane repeat protein
MPRIDPRRTALLVAALAAGSWTPAPGATLRVPEDAPSIQAGLSLAGAGDTVVVGCGTWLERDLFLPSGVVLEGETGDPACVILDAQGLGRGLACLGGDATTEIRGITVRNGFTTSHGAGLYVRDGHLRARDCRFEANAAGNWGGGAAFQGTSSPRFERCVFSGNSGLYGGGIFCESGTPDFVECRFEDNEARFGGGAIQIWYPLSSPTLEDCTFVENRSWFRSGGAIAVQYGTLSARRCTLFANRAPVSGSGVFVNQGALARLERCIVVSGLGAEAVACAGGGAVQIVCCDVWGHAEGDWVDCLAGLEGVDGNLSADPRFCDAPAGDFTLRSDSPCAPGASACGRIGAEDVGCGPTTVRARTWARIKSGYR